MSADQRQAVNEVLDATNRISEDFRISNSSQVASALSLSLGLGANLGSSSGKQSAISAVTEHLNEGFKKNESIGTGNNVGGSLTGKLGSNGESRNTDELARAIVNQAAVFQQRGISFDQSLATAVSSSDSFRHSLSQGDSLAQSTQASLSQAQTASQSAKTHFAQAESYQQSAQKAAESNATITVDNSAAAGNALLHDGQTLSKAYQDPANAAAIGGAAQQGLQSKQALENTTSGTAYSPAHSLQATDRPVNEVGAANAANQVHVQSGTSTAFGHVEQRAAQSGLSRPGVTQEIGKQQSALSQQSRVKTGEVEQTINQTGGILASRQWKPVLSKLQMVAPPALTLLTNKNALRHRIWKTDHLTG